MKTQNLIALAAAALFTATALAALNAPVRSAPLTEINGTRIIDLAPVEVRPSAADKQAASLLGDAGVASVMLAPALGVRAATGASLLGAQLAMPYYSFGTRIARASKE